MNCEVISRGDLEAYVFGEAEPRVARQVEAHLFGCSECATELRQLRSERRLFRTRLDDAPPAVPSFEDVLARIDSGGGHAADAVPSAPHGAADAVASAPRRAMDGIASRHTVDGIASRHTVDGIAPRRTVDASAPRRAAPGAFSRLLRTAPAVLAAAAAIGWLWVRGAGAPLVEPAGHGPEADETLIVAEPICGSGSPAPGAANDDEVRVPVSQEPISSVDLSAPSRQAAAVAHVGDDTEACSPGACGGTDALMTSACEDTVAWCAAGRQ